MIAVQPREDCVIEPHPNRAVDESQAWFWTEWWQRMERKAEQEIRAGKARRFENQTQLFKDLET
jgi:hypothetical protein